MLDNSFDEKKILELRNKIKDSSRQQKFVFEKNWFRNVLFYIGNQWISYYNSSKMWEKPRNLPAWFPTPVTNKFARAIDTIRAILIQKDPRSVVSPATSSDEDLAVAEVADSVIDVLDRETEIKTVRKVASAWYVMTGNVFCHTYAYESKLNGEIFIQFEQCTGCGEISPPDKISKNNNTCPKCNQPNFIKAIDQNNQPIGHRQPKTKICRDVASPFEIHCNQQIDDIKKLKCFVRTKSWNEDEIKEMYPDFADKITVDAGADNQPQDYLNTLAFTDNNVENGTILFSSTSGERSRRVMMDYVYSMPNTDFPDGLVATVNGNIVLEAMNLIDIYSSVDGKPFLPLAYAGYKQVPGRLWHKSASDDLIKKQIQRNILEAYIELCSYRMAKPHWLVPTGAETPQIDGEPGQIIEYTPGPRGEKPEMHPGVDVPASMSHRIEQIDKEMEDLAATYDALKGQSPTNINTYAGLKLLTERGYSSHMEMIKNWENFNEEMDRQALDIARNTMVEERIRTFKNDLGDWETETFTKADLQGGVDIKTEAGSSIPKSQAAEQAALVDSIKLGLIDIKNPAIHYAVLEKLGQADLKNDIDIDVKDAKKEWKGFLESVNKNPNDPKSWVLRPRNGIDNDIIHLQDAVMRAKTDEFFKMPPKAQEMWQEHIFYHQTNVEREQARQAGVQAQGQPGQLGNQPPATPGKLGQLSITKPEFTPV